MGGKLGHGDFSLRSRRKARECRQEELSDERAVVELRVNQFADAIVLGDDLAVKRAAAHDLKRLLESEVRTALTFARVGAGRLAEILEERVRSDNAV
jgi:hypothetical protein